MDVRKLLAIALVCLILFVSLNSALEISLQPSPIRVPDDFATIQEAINNAVPGDLILVSPDTYYEQLVIDKSITLEGENKTTTIIDGNLSGVCVQIIADDVVVSGFKFQNGLIGVSVENSSRVQIIDNIIIEMRQESVILSKSLNSVIINNTILNNAEGIHLVLSSNNTINQNKIDDNSDCGILLNNSTNNLIEGNDASVNHARGVFLADSNNNTIANNTIALSNDDGVVLERSHNNSLTENIALNNYHSGFFLVDSENNTLSWNVLEGNGWNGVALYHSNNNKILSNLELNNLNAGVFLSSSANNLLRNNTMAGNGRNFRVYGESLQEFLNDVDVSNMVDGRAVYYWINKHGSSVPRDAGYVAVINSTNIRVTGLALSNNGQGVLFAYTNNSIIAGIEANNNLYGVHFFHAYNNHVFLNRLMNNTFGVFMQYSENNTFYFNTVQGSLKGVVGSYAHGNGFFRNNFVNQTVQIDFYQSLNNSWDTGFEGNHWDSYAGADGNADGIGDVPYVLDTNNRDKYPLVHFYFPGDVNHDGTVNGTDADVVGQVWQSRVGEVGYSPFADLNFDGIINIADAAFVGLFWQRHE